MGAVRTGLRAVGVCTVLTLSGCFSLSRGAPPPEHFVLGGANSAPASPAPASLQGLTIGLRRLDLASYLNMPLIVVRRGDHQVEFSEFFRWGEDLGGGINRAVARYLAVRADFRGVDVAPWSASERHDYLIQLRVLRFEGVAPDGLAPGSGEAQMETAWEIIRREDGMILARGTTEIGEPGWRVGDHAGLVTLLDRTLERLADELITELQAVVGP